MGSRKGKHHTSTQVLRVLRVVASLIVAISALIGAVQGFGPD